MCVCVCACMRTCVLTSALLQACMCRSQSSSLAALLSFYLWRQGPFFAVWCCVGQGRWAVNIQVFCFCLQLYNRNAGITGMEYCAQLFVGSGGLNSGPHNCITSSLFTKPSLQPLLKINVPFGLFSYKCYLSRESQWRKWLNQIGLWACLWGLS